MEAISLKRKYNNKIAYIKTIRAFKSNRLSIDYKIIFYDQFSDPKLIKDSEKTYKKILSALKKDRSVIEVYENIEEVE